MIKTIKENVLEENSINKLFFDNYGLNPELSFFFPFTLPAGTFCWEDDYGKGYVLEKSKELEDFFMLENKVYDSCVRKILDDGVSLSFKMNLLLNFNDLYDSKLIYFKRAAEKVGEEYSLEQIAGDYKKDYFFSMEAVSFNKLTYFNLLNNEVFENFMPLIDVADSNVFKKKEGNKSLKMC